MTCNSCGFNYADNVDRCPNCGAAPYEIIDPIVLKKRELYNEASQIPYDYGVNKSLLLMALAGISLGLGILAMTQTMFAPIGNSTKIIITILAIPLALIFISIASLMPNKNKAKYRRVISQLAYTKYGLQPEEISDVLKELNKKHQKRNYLPYLYFLGMIFIAGIVTLIFGI